MKTAVIIHGLGDKKEQFDGGSIAESNRHWMPWLQQQLISKGILAQTPEMPDAYAPNYEKWSSMLERFDINEDTVLVGHSCGGGFLVRWLSEHKVNVGKVALVAPWLDPDIAERTKELSIFISSDDHSSVLDSVKTLRIKLKGVEIKEFSGKGHFTSESMRTDKFPELVEYLVN